LKSDDEAEDSDSFRKDPDYVEEEDEDEEGEAGKRKRSKL